ncbi:MAG TPA: toll/interleukin-1 receptor domain-containing protein [Caulobacteraceae bacterium]|jgi:hypothetical protein
MTTYFLSYARLDQAFALRLADDLIAAGLRVWVDQYDIQPAQHWDHEVEAAVRGCDGVVVVLSPRSAASPNVADEVAVALDDGKLIVPVLMEACKPPLRMSRMQFIDATRGYEAALAKCLTALAGAPVKGASATSLPDEVVRRAEARLTAVLGPIASVIVARGGPVTSEAELYERLGNSIDDATARAAFVAGAQKNPAPGRAPPSSAVAEDALAPDDLAALAGVLMRYLGPIAERLVAREKAGAPSREALCQALASHIHDERERAAFLREALPPLHN